VTIQASLFEIEQQIAESIEEKEDSSRLGRYAEFMVCAELTKLGYDVLHVDAAGFDIILSVDGASWRVQVKSTSVVREGYCEWKAVRHAGSTNGKKGMTRPTSAITRREADILALFHHQFGTVVFMPVGNQLRDPRGRKPRDDNASMWKIILPVAQVREHDPSLSIESTVARLMGGER
jgi:hypothetical protein